MNDGREVCDSAAIIVKSIPDRGDRCVEFQLRIHAHAQIDRVE